MPSIRFGNAELDFDNGELRVDGKRVLLGPRAFSLLVALAANRSRAVSKQELLDSVWRGVVVEENNLQVQISTLRRLLGPATIATIPGRGYHFMAPVQGDVLSAQPSAVWETAASPRSNLSERLPDLYGRDADCASVRDMLGSHALVSIVGAAGIGKTRLAQAVASRFDIDVHDGVWLVDLASVNDAKLLVPTLAQATRVSLPDLRDPQEELVAALRDQRSLFVLDNCEQIAEHLGPLLSHLLSKAAGVRVLATSQEPLHLEMERVYRLGPLAVPDRIPVADPLSYGAVRLLVERVRAMVPRLDLLPADVETVVDICRRLDGLPLAIELAAARVPVLGLAGVRDRLGERFRILTGGSRVAPKRHQTLRAALDWSLALLSDAERATYRRLGVFVGTFSVEAAQDVAVTCDVDTWGVLEHLSSLVDKSLVIAEGEQQPRYRMLESTREHALELLAQTGETDEWIGRHAQATLRALERAIRDRRMDLVLDETPNLRSAYEWALRSGHARIAVALATLPSMALAVDGSVQEARQRLLEVESLVDDSLPKELVAQYWQWVGRIGLAGRLPSSQCVRAFLRAEELFSDLKNHRHVHACRRHLAEALLESGDLDGAEAALHRAMEMEDAQCTVADRVRRLRVEGLWHAESGRGDEALQTATLALEMAQHAAIDRYELVLLNDIARIHLEAGRAQEASERYRLLADLAQGAPNAGLNLSNAIAGLIAALTGQGDLTKAEEVAVEALPVLRRSGILIERADVLACLMAKRLHYELAAQLLGASDKFRADSGVPRGPVEQRCREDALQILSHSVGVRRRAAWLAFGAAATEEQLYRAVLTALDRTSRRKQGEA